MALVRSSNSNLCVVCGSGSKGCSHDTLTDVVMCRGEHNNSDYRFSKMDRNGNFAIYYRSKPFDKNSPAGKKAYMQRQQQVRAQKAAEKAMYESLPSREERDAKFSLLLQELPLLSGHREELLRRGLTDPEELGFRSIKKYHKTKFESYGLPGFNSNHKYFSDSGILCPIRDSEGLLIGFQVMCDRSENGKYKWLGYKLNSPSHLRNRELPINVAQYGTSFVGFCEAN